MIDTAAALKSFLDGLPLDSDQPHLFIDLEGNKLSRHGTLSLITILVEPRHTIHLVGVHTLGKVAFSVASSNGAILKQILELVNIPKVFFDIRHDSDALYSLYGVSVEGIEDLQLMGLAARAGNDKRYVSSLSKCIEQTPRQARPRSKRGKPSKSKEKSFSIPLVVATTQCSISALCHRKSSATPCRV
jgi:exonuclease 3'-5' domain-containing protein 1